VSNESEEECALHDYEFEGGERIPELEEACFKAVARDADCGEQSVYDDCEASATVEAVEMADVYTCVSETECGDSPEACFPEDNDSLGDEICDEVDASCQIHTCSQQMYRVLRQASPWWREEVTDGARACLELLECRELVDCIAAWSEVAFQNTGLDDFLLWEY